MVSILLIIHAILPPTIRNHKMKIKGGGLGVGVAGGGVGWGGVEWGGVGWGS